MVDGGIYRTSSTPDSVVFHFPPHFVTLRKSALSGDFTQRDSWWGYDCIATSWLILRGTFGLFVEGAFDQPVAYLTGHPRAVCRRSLRSATWLIGLGDCGLFAEDASDLAFDFFDDAFLYTVAVEVADETGTLDLFDNLGH